MRIKIQIKYFFSTVPQGVECIWQRRVSDFKSESCFVIPEGKCLQIALFYGKGNIKCYGVLNAPQCLLINMFRSGKRKLSKSQTLQQCFVFYLFHLCSSLCLNFFNLEGTVIICEVAFEQQHPEPLFSNICVWPTSSIT